MIYISGLSKVYDSESGKFEALSNVSLKIEDGDIYGIINTKYKQ